MRVVCRPGSGGNVYRIYREDAQFRVKLAELVPFLSKCRGDVLIGRTSADPHVLLTVGPLDTDADLAFRALLGTGLVRENHEPT